MKKTILLMFIVLFIQHAFAQNTVAPPSRSIKVNVGRGKLGSGDINGLMVGVEYEKYFRRKLAWSVELGTTVHDDSDRYSMTNANGNYNDLSFRSTTAGVQLVGKIGFNFIKTKEYDFGVRLGGLLRYQSSSMADDIIVLYPPITGLPYLVSIVKNTTPQRTYSVGGISQLFASYTFKQKIVFGVTTGLQLDSNGDTIFPQVSLTIGKRF